MSSVGQSKDEEKSPGRKSLPAVGRKRILPKPSRSSSSLLSKSDAQRLFVIQAIISFEEDYKKLLDTLLTEFRASISCDRNVSCDTGHLDLLFPPLLQHMRLQSQSAISLMSKRVQSQQGSAVVGDIYHRLFDRAGDVEKSMTEAEAALFEYANTHASRKQLLDDILTNTSHPLYSILRIATNRVFDGKKTLAQALDAPFLHLRAWARKLRALLKATPDDHADAVFLKEAIAFFRTLSKELTGVLESGGLDARRPISIAVSDTTGSRDSWSSPHEPYRGPARLLELPTHEEESGSDGDKAHKKQRQHKQTAAVNKGGKSEDGDTPAKGAVISRPESFTHVVHMGPDALLFGGLSAAAKQELQNATPGRRAVVRDSDVGHQTVRSPTTPASSSLFSSFRRLSRRRKTEDSDMSPRSRSVRVRSSNARATTTAPNNISVDDSCLTVASAAASLAPKGGRRGEHEVELDKSPSLLRRGLRFLSRRSRSRSAGRGKGSGQQGTGSAPCSSTSTPNRRRKGVDEGDANDDVGEHLSSTSSTSSNPSTPSRSPRARGRRALQVEQRRRQRRQQKVGPDAGADPVEKMHPRAGKQNVSNCSTPQAMTPSNDDGRGGRAGGSIPVQGQKQQRVHDGLAAHAESPSLDRANVFRQGLASGASSLAPSPANRRGGRAGGTMEDGARASGVFDFTVSTPSKRDSSSERVLSWGRGVVQTSTSTGSGATTPPSPASPKGRRRIKVQSRPQSVKEAKPGAKQRQQQQQRRRRQQGEKKGHAQRLFTAVSTATMASQQSSLHVRDGHSGRLDVLRQVNRTSLPPVPVEIDDDDSLDFEQSDHEEEEGEKEVRREGHRKEKKETGDRGRKRRGSKKMKGQAAVTSSGHDTDISVVEC